MSKEKSIGELLEEAQKKSGAAKLAGHDIMDLEVHICRHWASREFDEITALE